MGGVMREEGAIRVGSRVRVVDGNLYDGIVGTVRKIWVVGTELVARVADESGDYRTLAFEDLEAIPDAEIRQGVV
jgi:hypothetical protein